jgi:hypothetical protein
MFWSAEVFASARASAETDALQIDKVLRGLTTPYYEWNIFNLFEL